MSYGSSWSGSPWGGASSLSVIVPVVFDVEVDDDHLTITTDVFTGLHQIPSFLVGAQRPAQIEVVFSVAMSIDSNFTNASFYKVTAAEGSVPISVVSVTPTGPGPIRRAILELGSDLDSKEYYSLVIDDAVVSSTGDPSEPDTYIFQWVDMTTPVFVAPLEIPIRDFSGEVRGGLLGNPDGQVFFTPAYDTVDADSTIELESVSVCTRAYDEYHLPAPPDPAPLLTWRPGITSVIGAGNVLWAPADRLGLPSISLTVFPKDDFQPANDFAVEAKLVEPIDITKAGFLNDARWKTFPATGATVFRTAANLSSIGPGPTTLLKLDYPKIVLDDSFPITDQLVINIQDVELDTDDVGIVDGLTVQNITPGLITITIDESVSILDNTKPSTQYVRISATDAIVTSDLVTVEKLTVLTPSASDTLAISDSSAIVVFRVLDASASDTLTITDDTIVVHGVVYDASAQDTISTADQTSASMELGASAQDTVSVTDSNALIVDYVRFASDTISITDVSDASLQGDVIADDLLDVTDAAVIQPFYLFSVTPSDTVSVTDSLTLDFYVAGSDNVSVSDSTSTSTEFGRALSDTSAVTESVTLDVQYDRSGSDTVSVVDDISASVQVGTIDVNAGTDSLTVTDSESNQVDKTLGDSVSVTDSTSAGREQDRTASDTAAITEVIWTGAPVQYHDTTFSPVGLWQFNESFNDSSGNGFNLTSETGTVAYGDIFPGVKGVVLDGVTTLVYNTSTATLGRTGDITIEMLLNLNAYTASKVLVSYANSSSGGSTTNALYMIEMMNSSTELSFLQENGSNSASRTSTFVNRPTLNTLCHFAMTRVSNVINLYLNGVLVETSSALTTPTGGGSSVFRVGSHSSRGSAPACTIASLKVVASALTGTQIASEYNLTLGRYYGEI